MLHNIYLFVCCCCCFQVSAFGEGNYLSTELSVCLNWSPGGPLWPLSSLAQSASCVALCEVIKHPSVL